MFGPGPSARTVRETHFSAGFTLGYKLPRPRWGLDTLAPAALAVILDKPAILRLAYGHRRVFTLNRKNSFMLPKKEHEL